MGVFLVGYDLKGGTEDEYKELIEALKEIGIDYWHCLDSTWFVVHDGPASAIRDALLPHLQLPNDKKNGDKLLVAQMSKGAAWTLSFPDECQVWLHKYF